MADWRIIPPVPGVFLSYRRDDVAGQVGRLFERLSLHFGEDFVFMDVESITPGEEFERVITGRIRDCDVFLLAIGPRWPTGRLQNADDLVRLEIAEALAANRKLLPLLVDRESLPAAEELPPEFRAVLGRHAGTIRHATFDRDVDELVDDLTALGIRPSRRYLRRRAEHALAAAGVPYSVVGLVSRTLGPAGGVGLLALALAASAWGMVRYGHARGFDAGVTQGHDAALLEVEKVTLTYEQDNEKERRESLRITGLITDGQQGVEAAEVTLTNTANDMSVTVETDSRGIYAVDLAKIEIGEGDVVRLSVIKPSYRKTIENVTYHQGFREFRAVLRK